MAIPAPSVHPPYSLGTPSYSADAPLYLWCSLILSRFSFKMVMILPSQDESGNRQPLVRDIYNICIVVSRFYPMKFNLNCTCVLMVGIGLKVECKCIKVRALSCQSKVRSTSRPRNLTNFLSKRSRSCMAANPQQAQMECKGSPWCSV